MSNGYAGKILRVNLTTKQVSSIETSRYEQFGGGYGIGAAIFWELCVAPGKWNLQDAFDPGNIVTLMSGPLAGTGTLSASRTSVSGLSAQGWPINWFSHSNFGGSFAASLKFAGWDGIVVEGASDKPVYINIADDQVTLEDAASLWGLNTWETQESIWQEQSAKASVRYGMDWQKIGNCFTIQRPAIVAIGPAGENRSRIASLVHGGGSGAGQGGFGGVFGSKNLKAIAVLGTGSIKVANPKAILDARQWFQSNWPLSGQRGPGRDVSSGASSCCVSCNRGCHPRDAILGLDSDGCAEAFWYSLAPPLYTQTTASNRLRAADLAQKLGINASEITLTGAMNFTSPPGHPIQPVVPAKPGLGWYVKKLYDMGIIGPGKKVDTHPLPMESYDKSDFAEIFTLTIAKRIGIGNLIADGTVRFAEKLGRTSDLDSLLRFPAWGYVDHWTMPTVEWAYGTLMDSRDINNHDMQLGPVKQMSCEEYVKLLASVNPPYADDPFMFDYSWQGEQAYKTGIYSEHKAKFVSWHQHYAAYYKESMLLCDWVFGNFYNPASQGGRGATPQAEPAFISAVTGKNISFVEGIETGRKIWNLVRAIFVMQGRTREIEKFSGYMYKPGASCAHNSPSLPVYNEGEWSWKNCSDLYLSEEGVERWKTAFYTLEGWNSKTGYPKRQTLESLGLKDVADVLQSRGKLG
jgi:aldehyde:ferredoxin oxidoreductase